jgi:hypothetical protein
MNLSEMADIAGIAGIQIITYWIFLCDEIALPEI